MKLITALLLTLYCNIVASHHVPPKPRVTWFDRASKLRPEYDYVIIGGGTSGLVVANRLTENPRSRCLLVAAFNG